MCVVLRKRGGIEVPIQAIGAVTRDLLDAGPTIDLSLANSALGISRAHGYALAKRGLYPVKLLKLGGSYRVVTSEMLTLLGILDG